MIYIKHVFFVSGRQRQQCTSVCINCNSTNSGQQIYFFSSEQNYNHFFFFVLLASFTRKFDLLLHLTKILDFSLFRKKKDPQNNQKNMYVVDIVVIIIIEHFYVHTNNPLRKSSTLPTSPAFLNITVTKNYCLTCTSNV